MSVNKIFVGRDAELKQFKKVLEDKQGQAILVVGQAGMGKTWLINKMAEIAENHPDLKCGWVRYEVTPTDSVESTMALMMDNAFEAAQVTERSFDGTERRLEQWRSLLNVINIGDLVMSLRRDPAKNTRDQFLERLRLVSGRMPEESRAIFVIDPEKYMQKDSDQSWAIVVKDLPEKIKFVFAQRPEDVLVESETINTLDNISRIPQKNLDVLEEEAVDELLDRRIGELKHSITEVQKVLSRYEGHPYALGAALDLLQAWIKLEELPDRPEPTKFAEKQWQRVCDNKDGAIELFEAYAVLEVGVPDDVVEAVSGLKPAGRKRVMSDKYIRGLLREETEGKRIYHAILADYILWQMGEEEKRKYHKRAVGVYREKLAKAEREQVKPDGLAAMRLPEHILTAEGKKAFVDSFVNECTRPLFNLGLLDAVMNFSERALKLVEKGSEEEAMVTGNLGLIYETRGDLDKAEEMFLKILEIHKKLDDKEGQAKDYGNLGPIYKTRGQLDKAEQMFREGLKIDEKLGRLEGMAAKYGNLGLIYLRRGQLDKAEQMHKKALKISEKLGRLEGMASDYGNLGVIYQTRGQLDKAEQMHNKSLEIAEKLGLQEVMANNYGNLGVTYQRRGELDKAEQMHNKSLEIEKKLGRLEGMANSYGNLGLIYQKRGDLDKAERMYLKSLEISEPHGLLEPTANQYSNLGAIYEQRGDMGKAKGYWQQALELFKKIGMKKDAEEVEGWIDGVESRK